MKILMKIFVLLILVLVAIMSTSVKLLIKIEEYVIGVSILLMGICILMAVINHMWLQLGIFILISTAIFMILFFSFQLDIWMEKLLESLKQV